MSSGNRKPMERPRSSDLIGAEAAMHRAARTARRRAEEVDVDLLIIKEGGDRELSARIYEGLRGVRVAVDAIVVSPADVERYKDSHALVIKPALQEGKVVYESA